MPARRFTRRRFGGFRGFGLRPVNSIKNQVVASGGISGTTGSVVIAKAVQSPSPTVDSDTENGCSIKAIWLSFDVCGLAGTGVLNNANMYFVKNPGDNLTNPSPTAWGTSNEKKFIFKAWSAMIMRNQDGNVPYHWEGWIPIPRRYQRMGTDDIFYFVLKCTATLTGHYRFEAIYKWYR